MHVLRDKIVKLINKQGKVKLTTEVAYYQFLSFFPHYAKHVLNGNYIDYQSPSFTKELEGMFTEFEANHPISGPNFTNL